MEEIKQNYYQIYNFSLGKVRVDPRKRTFFKPFDNSHNAVLAMRSRLSRP